MLLHFHHTFESLSLETARVLYSYTTLLRLSFSSQWFAFFLFQGDMFRVAASRALSTSARRDADLVQQAFIKKIKEFGQKGGDLVNTNPEVKKALQDELNRLAQKFHLANADIVGRIPTNFEAAKVESSVGALLEGKSVASLSESIKKEKSEYVAARAAKKAAEAARAAAIKGN